MAYPKRDAGATAGRLGPIPAPGIGRRIAQAADSLGSRTYACSVMGVSQAALQRYIKEENSPPFDALARLCINADHSLEWLATGEEPAKPLQDKASGPSQGVTLQNVRLAVQLLQEELDAANLVLKPDAFAEAVAILVQLLERGLLEAEVIPLARGVVRTASGGKRGGTAATGG